MTYLMSKPRFVYCFTKKLSTELDKYKITLKVFSDSVKYLSEYYEYKIYTDKDTFEDIKHLGKDIQLFDTDNFIFADDFKVSLLDFIDQDEIIIDPDVLIYRPLNHRKDQDVVFCHRDNQEEYWYQDNIPFIENTLLCERIKLAGKIPFIPNLGFLQIYNSNLIKEYTSTYFKYREDLLNKVTENLFGASILLGQYLLGILLYEGNYSYFSHRDANTEEQYVHLAGPQKFEIYKNK